MNLLYGFSHSRIDFVNRFANSKVSGWLNMLAAKAPADAHTMSLETAEDFLRVVTTIVPAVIGSVKITPNK